MELHALHVEREPILEDARLLLGFSGWMDGGDASTGTVQYLVRRLKAVRFADIDPADFYIYNVPGSMETAAQFRPHTRIANGLVKEYEEPENAFYFDHASGLILFEGKEPNLRWDEFAQCIFEVVERFGVKMICFVGSVAAIVPHTRETRFHGSVSNKHLRTLLTNHDVL
ncbi:MAG TPA: PAC2 family protein, partial [Candidatus Hydrogenedentes bacterium]|nr:PAC2 family protein [Candidatus Hydrogenedentota bacterium]